MRVRSALLAVLPFTAAAGLFAIDWQPQTSPTRAELRGLSVVSDDVAWASGRFGQVLRTTDGGTTWTATTVPGADSLDFRDIAAIDAQVAFAMSAGEAEKGQARIYRTTDAGRSWTQVYATERAGVFLDAIKFHDRQRGIALSDPIGGRWTLLRTEDGGTTWIDVPPTALPPMLPGEAAFAASGTSMALHGGHLVWIGSGGAARARVFRSADAGRSWTVVDTPVASGDGAAGIFSIAFADSLHGVVVGGDYRKAREASANVALTDDGGRSWRLARGPLPPGYLSAVAYVPGTSGRSLVATGLVGTAVSIDGGESWTMRDTLGYNSVAFASRYAGWAVGPRGRIGRWEGAIGGGIPIRK